MKSLIIALLIFSALSSAEEYELSPFQIQKGEEEYKAASWTNFDIMFFAMAVADGYSENKKWPKTIVEIDKSFDSFVLRQANEEELKEFKEKQFSSFASRVSIDEAIPMWEGMMYRLTYRIGDGEIKGYVMLSEGDSYDSILETLKLSYDFGSFTHSVPF